MPMGPMGGMGKGMPPAMGGGGKGMMGPSLGVRRHELKRSAPDGLGERGLRGFRSNGRLRPPDWGLVEFSHFAFRKRLA